MPPYLLVLCLTFAVVASLGAGVAAWSRRDDPVVKAFLALTAGVALWSGGRLMELSSADLDSRILWAKLQYFGIVAVPLAWLCAMIQLSRPRYVMPWSRLTIPVLINLLTLVLVFTNERHHLIWRSVTLAPPGSRPPAIFVHGAAYFVIAAWSYLLLFASLYFLLTARVPNASLTRGGRTILACGLALPLCAHIAYLNGWTGRLGGDLTPATFSMMSVLVWLCALRTHLDDIGHYARLRVFDALREGCVIVNADQRVVDFNPASLRLLPGLQPGDSVPAAWADAIEATRAGTLAPQSFLPVAAGGAEYELTLEPVRRLDGKAIGTIAFLRDVSHYRSRENALTVRLDATEQELSRLADDLDRDALTGLLNRRYFQRAATAAVLTAHAKGSPLGLLVLDVDNFKHYNDRHGHVAGDECLRQVAAAISCTITDPAHFCARLGGEEFALVLPGAGAAVTCSLGEALVAAVRSLKLEHAGAAAQPFVTVSVGAVCERPASEDLDPLLEKADAAMYQAKRSGRDRFVMHGVAAAPSRVDG
ncbi:histidine kinase N-terminal 7TM domain-containing protein [Cupriavidus sp. IDO]|uniref:histidine kinase N-terminal 7TM domain-containing protein n=1 Tax=Cupriavidus sp. IDO TaxID=1539142 RepID=UPI000579111F|nr:histidine kinase N-terminal 7TM domain-containing protein [Cupriavidus sp. IDO]KWR88432.1 diguanylate cyclase [Cupriavidus sp. IDO]